MNKYLNEYILHCEYERKLSDKTIKAYRIDLLQFISFIKLEDDITNLTNIDKNIVRFYLQSIHHRSVNTIKRKVASLKAFFAYHEFEDNIVVNPFRKLRLAFRASSTLPKVIALSDLNSMYRLSFEKLQGKNTEHQMFCALRNICILELLINTGVRVSELCNIKKSDIKQDNCMLKIIGKGNKERIVPIPNADVVLSLSQYANTNNSYTSDFFLSIDEEHGFLHSQ